MALRKDLAEARARADEHAITQTLVRLAQTTPLFADELEEIEEWIIEARDLAFRTVLTPIQEVQSVLRRAEVFLARGGPREAFDVATEACRLAHRLELPGLEDRAWMVEARALVRLGRQDDALALFERISDHQVPTEKEDPIVPGLAFLAVGEAHLFEGRYEGAYGPLQRAISLLPRRRQADRLRYDVLVGLGMLDHRAGEFETAAIRYDAAMKLADRHSSRPEQVESLLLMGSLFRGQGKVEEAHALLRRALKLSGQVRQPVGYLAFPTERLRNLVGHTGVQETMDAATELARDCGVVGDLMGYVQLTVIVASLLDLDGRLGEARAMLQSVASGLSEGGQELTADVLRLHLQGYAAP